MKFAYRYLLYFFIGLFLACDSDDSSDPVSVDNQNTIADFLRSESDYSDLVIALNRAGLIDGLDGSDPFTLLAPDDLVLAELLAQYGHSSVLSVPQLQLRDILRFHVLEGSFTQVELSEGYRQTEVRYLDTDRKVLLYGADNNGLRINDSTAIGASTELSNGRVHRLVDPLPLSSLADLIGSNPEYTQFLAAVQYAAVNGPDYAGVLDGLINQGLTVLAPGDDAFEALYEALGITTIQDLSRASVREMVNLHIIRSVNIFSSNVESLDPVESFGGSLVEFGQDGVGFYVTDEFNGNVPIIQSDLQAGNGVFHRLGGVLLSQSVAQELDLNLRNLIDLDPEYNVFFRAIEAADMVDFFADVSVDRTVFAPTNFAMNFYLDGTDIDDIPVAELQKLILNHVMQGVVTSDQIQPGYLQSLANSAANDAPLSLLVTEDPEDGLTINGEAVITVVDQEATNGVLHRVNRVLAVPTVSDFVNFHPSMAQLNDAMDINGLPNYEVILQADVSGQAPFTLFAPNNQAFEQLLVELGIESLEDLPVNDLRLALDTHYAANQNITSDILESGPLTTVGGEVQINAGAGTITDQNGRTANIVLTDIQADNGVIHLIDLVLLGFE